MARFLPPASMSPGRGRRRVLWAVALASIAAACSQPESVICPSGRICPRNFYCAAHQDICIPVANACGNGVVDKSEVCDDGNVINDDDCSRDCKSNNECGNGMVDSYDDTSRNEMCDEGRELNGQPMHCSADCKSNGLCGNGYQENGESCDYCKDDPLDVDASVDTADDGSPPGDASSDGTGAAGPDAAGAKDGGSSRNSVCGRDESRTCNHNCTVSRCGDRDVNRTAGEQCDDGGETMACNIDCTIASCGDGKVNRTAGEECDVRGGADTSNCNGASAASAGKACHFPECGDGYVNAAAGETCDVLGGADTRDCNGNVAEPGVRCRTPRCGDGYVNSAAGETCDTLGGGDTRVCNGVAAATSNPATSKACLATACGDGYVNRAADETCEVPADGSDTMTCNGFNAGPLKCTLSSCGDAYVNVAAGEACEPPGGADTMTCNGRNAGDASCKPRRCGDGYRNPVAETCEVSTSGADTVTCNGSGAPAQTQCHDLSCGDGYVNGAAGETCDDSNGADSSTCNGNGAGGARCKRPQCGDGYINTGAGEECDDHNATAGDGCSSICKREAGFNCATPGSACTPTCGDGVQVSGEACDDSNTSACGTCSANCATAQPPGAATGTITVGSNGSGVTFDNNNMESFSLSDGIHARLTFRFTSAAPPPGNIAIDIGNNTGGTQMAAKIAIAINSVGRALAINAGVSPSNSRQVVLVNSNPGSFGNQGINNSVADTDFVVSGMAGGVGYDCATAVGCKDGRDCSSGVCSASHACLSASCADGVLNGTETDNDCGGNSGACPRCSDGEGCILDSDCSADSRCSAGSCVTTCGDNSQNGTETDTDCGGGCSSRCANGKKCNTGQDCQPGSQCGVPPAPPGPDGGAGDAGTTRVCF